ncbi:hypothetical protein [Streptomyces niveus]|uniref:Uncharacterized protein n=1 Tax=Streptomyces niveus TaxID=193462 RepID=A0ABZ1ZXX1_STRNV|nr:hypothetical protein [Streptomyces niveus]
MTTSSQNPNLPSREAHQLYLRQLATYLRESKQILDAWDVYSDNHCDPETFEPYDEATYGIRQRQRDADTLNAFGRVYFHADVLVDIAEHQLARLPASATQHFAWRLGELCTVPSGCTSCTASGSTCAPACPRMPCPAPWRTTSRSPKAARTPGITSTSGASTARPSSTSTPRHRSKPGSIVRRRPL